MYESHITIADSFFPIEKFKQICNKLSTKPLIIEDEGSFGVQMMTAKFHKTNNFVEAIDKMHFIANEFRKYTIVTREKLEFIIGKKSKLPDKYYYLEFHSKYIVPNNYLYNFTNLVKSEGGHTSENILKETKPGFSYRFMTTRDELLHNQIKDKLKSYFELVNTIRECVVYDSNPSLDKHIKCFECPIKEYINEKN